MGEYSCYYEGVHLILNKHCDSGKSQSQRKIVVLQCPLSSSLEDLCSFDSGFGESDIPSANKLRELNNTSVCMTCCGGFCYLPVEVPSPTAEEFHGYITSAIISFTFTLLVVLFGVIAYRIIKKRRREKSRVHQPDEYDVIHPPRAQEQLSTARATGEASAFEMVDLSRNDMTSVVTRSSSLSRQTASDKCVTCGQRCSSRRPSVRNSSSSSVEAGSNSALSPLRRTKGSSLKRTRLDETVAIPTQLDLEDPPITKAPPLPPRRRSSVNTTLASVARSEHDIERLETEIEPSVILLGLEPAVHSSKLVQDLENLHRKKRRRNASGSLSRKKSPLSIFHPPHRSSSMF